jgi:hypothetical protein
VGGLLAAMQLLPSLELVTRSSRPQQAAAEAVKSALPVSNLVTYLVPNFYGSPANQTYWGNLRGRGTDFFETACYLGVLPLLLALLGAGDWRAADPRRRFMARFLVIAGLFALLLALGSPVYYLFYWLIPPFRQLSGVARAVSLAAFAGAGLAALGTERLLADPPRVSRWFLPGFAIGALALVGAVVAQYAGVVLSNDPKLAEVRGFWWREMALFGALLLVALVLVHLRRRGRIGAHAFATAAFVVVVFDLFRFGINFNPACNPKTVFFETPSLCRRSAPAHHGHQFHGQDAPQHADGLRPARYPGIGIAVVRALPPAAQDYQPCRLDPRLAARGFAPARPARRRLRILDAGPRSDRRSDVGTRL